MKKTTSNKKLIFPLIILSIISLIYIFGSIKTPSQVSNITSRSISPTPNATIPKFIYFSPPEGLQETFWTTTAIEFKFDQPMNIGTLRYSVSPETPVMLASSQDKNSVYIRAKNGWEYDKEYSIKITYILSEKMIPFSTPINYSFKIVQPKNVISQ